MNDRDLLRHPLPSKPVRSRRAGAHHDQDREAQRIARDRIRRRHAYPLALLMVATVGVSASAHAEPDPMEILSSTTSLKCRFPVGRIAAWETGKPVLQPDSFSNDFIFDSLDPDTRTGRFIGNAGSADVTVTLTAGELVIVESTPAGAVQITVVFASFAKGSQEFIATHSRHTPGIYPVTEPIPSQYHGTCKPWH